jgi:hypothetical protein
MNRPSSPAPAVSRLAVMLFAAASTLGPSPLFAQKKRSNPASKVYISDVAGEAQIDTGDSIDDVAKRSVYNAQGTVIETKKSDPNADKKAYSTMVYSNGTGAFFDEDTRVEVKKFNQEPFTPNRADIDLEPSVSQTQAFVARGTVGLCTSKLVAGSSMTYQTSQGSVNIRGRKVVIEAQRNVTKISMLEGDSTVRAGANDMGGHTLKAGEQAIIREGEQGQPNVIQISKIPPQEINRLDDKVAMACMAKKTVYFDVREKKESSGDALTSKEQAAEDAKSDAASQGSVTAFDDSGSSTVPVREIVPIEIVPVTAPVDAILTTSRASGAPLPGG